MTNKKPFYKKWWFILIVFILIGTAINTEDSNKIETTSRSDLFQETIREKFTYTEKVWNDESPGVLEKIDCMDNCGSIAYFRFNSRPDDLETAIRGNTATFSKIKMDHTNTSHVTIYATLDGNTIFQCSANKGIVSECK